jgi:hypothetical protein
VKTNLVVHAKRGNMKSQNMRKKSTRILARLCTQYSKRAMDANQMFIYITVVVVVGFVFIFGFRAVGGFQKSITNVNDFQLQKSFTDKVTEIRADHDSSTPYTYKINQNTKHVCFFDIEKIRNEQVDCQRELSKISLAAQTLCTDLRDRTFAPINVIHINQDGSIGQNYYVEGLRLPELDATGTSYTGNFHVAQCSSGNSISLYLHGVRQKAFLQVLD